MTGSELALFAFTACNTLRVVAYVPQIVKIARDNGGASAISYSTWGLFGASHLSTVAYALAALDDWRLAFIFTANAAACGAIVALTMYKRLRFAVQATNSAQRDLIAPDLDTASMSGPCAPRFVPEVVANHVNAATSQPEWLRIAGGTS